MSHSWKSLPNHLTRDKIGIHGNAYIIIHILFVLLCIFHARAKEGKLTAITWIYYSSAESSWNHFTLSWPTQNIIWIDISGRTHRNASFIYRDYDNIIIWLISTLSLFLLNTLKYSLRKYDLKGYIALKKSLRYMSLIVWILLSECNVNKKVNNGCKFITTL